MIVAYIYSLTWLFVGMTEKNTILNIVCLLVMIWMSFELIYLSYKIYKKLVKLINRKS